MLAAARAAEMLFICLFDLFVQLQKRINKSPDFSVGRVGRLASQQTKQGENKAVIDIRLRPGPVLPSASQSEYTPQ